MNLRITAISTNRTSFLQTMKLNQLFKTEKSETTTMLTLSFISSLYYC